MNKQKTKKTSKYWLNKAQEHAKLKGGECLSNIYISAHKPLEWKCENKEHDSWFASYSNITSKDSWCPQCAGRFSPTYFLKTAKKHANQKGGDCLSINYKNSKEKLKWKCHVEEHEPWEALYYNVVDHKGTWCPQCSGKFPPEYFFKKAQEHAKLKGGNLLSHKYENAIKKLKWKCSNPEHEPWEANYNSIVCENGSWCPQCVGHFPPEYFFKKAQEHAKLKGGECLSTEYVGNNKRLLWKCHVSQHEPWLATYSSVLKPNGSWCPRCAEFHIKEHIIRRILNYLFDTKFIKAKPKWNINPKTNKPLELDGYSEELKIAFEFQGEHHYKDGVFHKQQKLKEIEFKDRTKKKNCKNQNIKLLIFDGRLDFSTPEKTLDIILNLLNKNKIEINFKFEPAKIKELFFQPEEFQNTYLTKAKEHAKSKGGECLSTEYVGNNKRLLWKCSNPNHASWEATFKNVVYVNTWCPRCAGRFSANERLQKAQNYAKSRDGECLSSIYKNSKEKMKWICLIHNDIFFSSYEHTVNRNHWNCEGCKFQKK